MYNKQSTLIQFLLIGRCHYRHTHQKKMDPDCLYFDHRSQADRQAGGQSLAGTWPPRAVWPATAGVKTRGRRRAQTRYSGAQAGAMVAPHRGPAEIPGSGSELLLDKMRDGSQRLWNSQRTSLRHSNDDHQEQWRPLSSPKIPTQLQ